MVAGDAIPAGREALGVEVDPVGGRRVPDHGIGSCEAGDVLESGALVLFEFHGYILAIWRGTCLKTTFISSSRSDAIAQRSA